MPSKSPAQARLMAAAAHTPGGFGGVSQSVGREFNNADRGSPMLTKGHGPKTASYASGGPVTGRNRDFMKTPDEFRTDKPTDTADKIYGKIGKGPVAPVKSKAVMKKN